MSGAGPGGDRHPLAPLTMVQHLKHADEQEHAKSLNTKSALSAHTGATPCVFVIAAGERRRRKLSKQAMVHCRVVDSQLYGPIGVGR